MTDKPSRFRSSKGMSLALAVSGFAALFITILMNRHAGAAMGATEEGRMLLSAAAIAVDVVGICVFGMAAGALLAARGAWMKGLGVLFGVVMLGSVGFSIMSIMNFVGAERLSVDQAIREKAEERARRQIALEAATKERNRIANETAEKAAEKQRQLAEQHLKWLQGQSRRDDLSRKERKEILTGAGDVIAKMGQAPAPQARIVEPEAPTADTDVLVRTEKGAEMIAEFSGLQARAVIALQMGWVAILLIVYKALAFPGAALLWPREAVFELIPAIAPATATPKIPALQAVASAPLALPGPGAGNVTPLPQGNAPGKASGETVIPPTTKKGEDKVAVATHLAPRNPFLGKPAPGSEAELRSIRFPLDGRTSSVARPKLPLKDACENFVKGLQAFGFTNVNIWSDAPHPEAISQLWIGGLYQQWSEAYHFEMCRLEDLRAQLKKTRGVEHKERERVNRDPDKRDETKRRHCFVVAGRRYPKAEDPAPPGGGAEAKRPFSVALSVAANDTAPRRFAVVPTRSFQPDGERWSLHDQIAEARRLKAEQRGQSRQMRRTQHRWAA